jgi:hypothetical protein
MLFYIAAALYVHGFQPIPRSVFFLDAMLTFIMSGGLRMAIHPYMSDY